jgi:hypothetical protein
MNFSISPTRPRVVSMGIAARVPPKHRRAKPLGSAKFSGNDKEAAMNSQAETKRFTSFAEFYPFYLGEHTNFACRRLHFVGSTQALLCLVGLVVTFNPLWMAAAVISGYGFAWIGHFFFEHNKPAMFRQPLYSFMGDWRMYWQILSRQIPF